MRDQMINTINEQLTEAVNSIFLKLQEEHGIPSGDIGFDREYDLNELTEQLAELIADTIEEQKEIA